MAELADNIKNQFFQNLDTVSERFGVHGHARIVQTRCNAGTDTDVSGMKFRFLLFEVVEVFSAATAVFSDFFFTEYFADGLANLVNQVFVVNGERNNAARECDFAGNVDACAGVGDRCLEFSSSSVIVSLSWARISRIILPLSGMMLVAVEAQSMDVTLADQALFGLTQREFTALVARTALQQRWLRGAGESRARLCP